MATSGAISRKDLAHIRRTSSKVSDNQRALLVESEEKDSPHNTTSDATFHDRRNASPDSLDLPRKPSTSILCDTDIEGQHEQEFPFGIRSLRTKLVERVVIFLVLIIWMLLLMGVLILTDTLFPTALRSYHRMKELRSQLSRTTFELEEIQAQISILQLMVGRMRLVTIQTYQK